MKKQWLLAGEVTLKMAAGDILWWVFMWKTQGQNQQVEAMLFHGNLHIKQEVGKYWVLRMARSSAVETKEKPKR